MTPMQEFVLNILKDNPAGVQGSYVGDRWQERDGRRAKCASRDSFGATAAAYKSLRSLVALGYARVERYKTSSGWLIETYYPA